MESHFYIEEKKASGSHQIIMYITDPVFKPRVKYYTGEKIKGIDWNPNKERGKGTFNNSLNAYLDALVKRADDLRLELKGQGKFTREHFINLFKEDRKKNLSLYEHFNNWIEYCKTEESDITDTELSDPTIGKYKVLKSVLEDYEKKRTRKLTVESFTHEWYKDFKKYVFEERENDKRPGEPIKPNTFAGYVKNLKKFLKYLLKKDKSAGIEWQDYKVKFNRSEDLPFREEELLLFYSFDPFSYSAVKRVYELFFPEWRTKRNKAQIRLRIESIARARLAMLLLCSTGKRISDYQKMDQAEIDGEIIKFKAKKNQVVCYVPNFDDLYFRPVYIVNEMIRLFGGIPKISGQKLNDAIEELCKVVGFTRFKPKSKVGRKSFATLKTKLGVIPEITMKSTGHKTRKSFDDYVIMDEFDVIKENKEKATYLKKAI
jgi:hypothetical protein